MSLPPAARKYLFPYLDASYTDVSAVWVAGIHAVFLCAFCISAYRYLRFRFGAYALITDFSEGRIYRNRFLSSTWKKYSHRFFTTKSELRKTHSPAETDFNLAAVGVPLHFRFWSALPGILAGLGILGTFFGLTMGLSRFEYGGSAMLQDSIRALFQGTKTAFFTSLHGIALSIGFGVYLHVLFRLTEQDLHRFCRFLNDRFRVDPAEAALQARRETEERIQNRTDTLIRRIQDAVREIAESIAHQERKDRADLARKHLRGIRECLRDTAADLTAVVRTESASSRAHLNGNIHRLETDLPDKMETAGEAVLKKTVTPALSRFARQLEQLQETSASLESQLKSPFSKEITNRLEGLADRLSEIFEEIMRPVSREAAAEFDRIVSKLSETTQRVSPLPDAFREAAREIRRTSEHLSDRRAALVTEFTAAADGFRDILTGAMETLSAMEQKREERERSLSQAVDETLAGVAAHLRETENAQNTAKTVLTDLLDQSRAVMEQDRELLGQIQYNHVVLLKRTEKFGQIIAKLDTGLTQIDQISRSLERIGDQFDRRFADFQHFVSETLTAIRRSQSPPKHGNVDENPTQEKPSSSERMESAV
jgi:ABC-type transporter Mla subunit MlaD